MESKKKKKEMKKGITKTYWNWKKEKIETKWNAKRKITTKWNEKEKKRKVIEVQQKKEKKRSEKCYHKLVTRGLHNNIHNIYKHSEPECADVNIYGCLMFSGGFYAMWNGQVPAHYVV